jgi:prepilin signal peptidase PulO-like enzyme (type II secretory pathway)
MTGYGVAVLDAKLGAIILLAGLLAWAGARWSLALPYYEQQRRAVPARTFLTVAVATIAAAIAAPQGENGMSQLFLALWSTVFTLVTVIDIETHFIPDRLILPATAAALLASLVDPRLTWLSALLGALIGFVLFYLIVLLARGGFGMGDAKLSAFIGAVTGLAPLIYALLAGILAGGLGALILLATRRVGRRSYMPYGPFLCLGGWLGMLPAVARLWGF